MRKCAITLVVLIMAITACASIVSNKKYPVTVSSSPNNAHVTVKNTKGDVLFSGRTPTTVTLDASSGYFQTAQYEIEVSKTDTVKKEIILNGELDSWYLGNFVIGGIFGLLVVDPSTGCMWKLDDRVHADLPTKTSWQSVNKIKIITQNNVSSELIQKLTRIQ